MPLLHDGAGTGERITALGQPPSVVERRLDVGALGGYAQLLELAKARRRVGDCSTMAIHFGGEHLEIGAVERISLGRGEVGDTGGRERLGRRTIGEVGGDLRLGGMRAGDRPFGDKRAETMEAGLLVGDARVVEAHGRCERRVERRLGTAHLGAALDLDVAGRRGIGLGRGDGLVDARHLGLDPVALGHRPLGVGSCQFGGGGRGIERVDRLVGEVAERLL